MFRTPGTKTTTVSLSFRGSSKTKKDGAKYPASSSTTATKVNKDSNNSTHVYRYCILIYLIVLPII